MSSDADRRIELDQQRIERLRRDISFTRKRRDRMLKSRRIVPLGGVLCVVLGTFTWITSIYLPVSADASWSRTLPIALIGGGLTYTLLGLMLGGGKTSLDT